MTYHRDDVQAPLPQMDLVGLITPASYSARATLPQREPSGPDTSARVISVDPGQRGKGCTILYPSGEFETGDLLMFATKLRPGDILVTESTLHSYNPDDRRLAIEAILATGAQIWGMRSIFTSRARKELGLEKSHENDATAILHYWQTRPNLFYRLKPNPCRLGTKREIGTPRYELNRRLVELRRAGYPGFIDGHEATIQVLAEVAVEFKLSRKEFNSFAGFCGTGYPNLARSDRNKHYAGKNPDLWGGRMKAMRKAARTRFSDLKKLQAQAISPRQSTTGGHPASALVN